MSGNSVDRLNSFNEEAEQFIDEIERMSVEEEKVDNINNEDMYYDIEDEDLKRTSRENFGTGVKR